jgi:hypothetical protein
MFSCTHELKALVPDYEQTEWRTAIHQCNIKR